MWRGKFVGHGKCPGEYVRGGMSRGERPKLESVDPTCLKGLVDHGPIDRR